MEIRLELSDSLVGAQAQVVEPCVWQRQSPPSSTFVESHRLLLAQSLALGYSVRQLNVYPRAGFIAGPLF